ncbi:MAG TPA: TMEM175 family protein [Gemmatimonadota bacterium]|nr:TMEM175 family protein [Gemmatimonadota bacterium]
MVAEEETGQEPVGSAHGLADDRRITTLADNMFGIVMTLLVLGIDVPQVPDDAIADRLVDEVFLLWPRIAAYVVSFLFLGIFWMGHHTQFHFMRGVNKNVLWINILFFMCVCLVPFTTRLVGRYNGQEIALGLYGLNLIAINLMLLVHWRYAAHADLLTPETGSEEMRKVSRRILVGVAMFAAAIAVSFVSPRWSLAVFLLVPLLHVLPGPIHMHWTR